MMAPPGSLAPAAPAAGTPRTSSQQDFVQRPCKSLPDDPTSKHPVMLINEMYPGLAYECGLRAANSASGGYTMTITIEGQQFSGMGRCKKDAKRMCAVAAAKALLNIDYGTE